jgi:hypothetical protein
MLEFSTLKKCIYTLIYVIMVQKAWVHKRKAKKGLVPFFWRGVIPQHLRPAGMLTHTGCSLSAYV